MDVANAPSPREAGDYQYFVIRRVGQDLPIIYRRPAPDEEEEGPIDLTGDYEVVLDPHGRSPGNTMRFSIVTFSRDGNLSVAHLTRRYARSHVHRTP